MLFQRKYKGKEDLQGMRDCVPADFAARPGFLPWRNQAGQYRRVRVPAAAGSGGLYPL